MEKRFNKLVRDNIPDIIKREGKEVFTRILGEEEYKEELYKKLIEEVNEVLDSKSTDETLEELGDCIEVIRAIAKLNSRDIEDVLNISKEKRAKRGGFDKKIFLEKTISKE